MPFAGCPVREKGTDAFAELCDIRPFDARPLGDSRPHDANGPDQG
jgi:hypothetical protein